MRSIRIPYRVAREIRSYLDPKSQLVAALDSAMAVKKSVKASRVRRTEKKKSRKEEWAAIREAVLRRADGHCECGCHNSENDCPGCDDLEVDHMFGGGGRRKSLESIYTCWALTPYHHRLKTKNGFPGPAGWLGAFIAHCNRKDVSGHGANPDGYLHAASIAQARLDSLTIQNRAGGES